MDGDEDRYIKKKKKQTTVIIRKKYNYRIMKL